MLSPHSSAGDDGIVNAVEVHPNGGDNIPVAVPVAVPIDAAAPRPPPPPLPDRDALNDRMERGDQAPYDEDEDGQLPASVAVELETGSPRAASQAATPLRSPAATAAAAASAAHSPARSPASHHDADSPYASPHASPHGRAVIVPVRSRELLGDVPAAHAQQQPTPQSMLDSDDDDDFDDDDANNNNNNNNGNESSDSAEDAESAAAAAAACAAASQVRNDEDHNLANRYSDSGEDSDMDQPASYPIQDYKLVPQSEGGEAHNAQSHGGQRGGAEYAQYNHRPLSQTMSSLERQLPLCKRPACIVVCIVLMVVLVLGAVILFASLSYCLFHYIGTFDNAWDPAYTSSYCPWFGTIGSENDLFNRMLPAGIGIAALLLSYALVNQIWWHCLALKTASAKVAAATGFEPALENWNAALHDPRNGGVRRMSVFFEGLRYSLNDTRILDDASGEIKSGEVTAILGPSGCGKTTLMHILLGLLQPSAGTISINGSTDVTIRDVRKLIGFVPQDDVMISELTVEEVVWLSARMRMESTVHSRQVRTFVDTILDVLELSQLRHCRIGDETRRGLSGGQKKRVNVAMELAMNPSLVFLDEPTSGLDSSMALNLMRCLRKAANAGWAICLVIHQPSSAIYKCLDSVIVMGKGGQTLFSGPTQAASVYFRSVKPDFFVDEGGRQVAENMAETVLDIASSHPAQGDLAMLWTKFLDQMSDDLRAARQSLQPAFSASNVDAVVVDVGPHSGGAALFAPQKTTSCCNKSPERVRINCCLQYFLFLQRSFTQKLRSFGSVVRNGVLVYILGSGVGFLFMDIGEACVSVDDCDNLSSLISNMVQAFVIAVLCITVVAMQAGLDDFGAERSVYFREQRVRRACGIGVSVSFVLSEVLCTSLMLVWYACTLCARLTTPSWHMRLPSSLPRCHSRSSTASFSAWPRYLCSRWRQRRSRGTT